MRGMRSCPVQPRNAGRRCAFDRIGPACPSDLRCDAIARVEGSFYRHDNKLPMNINHNVVQAATAALALPISILAAVFTWQQLEIGREHNRLSVAPILHITPYLEGIGGKNGFYMTNEGLDRRSSSPLPFVQAWSLWKVSVRIDGARSSLQPRQILRASGAVGRKENPRSGLATKSRSSS